MTVCTISIDRAGPDSVLHRTVLASLPNSYELVDGAAEVVLVSASDAPATEQAVDGGARAVVLDRPGRLSVQQLAALEAVAEQHGCALVPAPTYGPRLAAAPDLLEGAKVDLVESTITSSDSLRSSLVEQLALLRQVLGTVASIRILHSSASTYTVEASMADHPRSQVLLNGLASTSGIEEASLHAIGRDRHLAVRIDAGPVARPADISLFDRGGRHSPWPVHQHAHRITLRLLHEMLIGGEGGISYSIKDLRHDVRLADALTE
jgi:transposase